MKVKMALSILMLSTLLGVSSSQWATLWMMLEVNTLSMCMMMSSEWEKMKKKMNPILIYYIMQVMSSLTILVSATIKIPSNKMILMVSLMAKMGMWPMHLWFMKMVEKTEVKMKSMKTMISWQKILPIMMMCSSKIDPLMITMVSTMSLVWPLTNMKKNMEVKKIIGITSVNTNGWMTLSLMASVSMTMVIMMMYFSALIYSMGIMEDSENKKTNSFMTMTAMANISALPPFPAFWAKVTAIKTMIMSSTPTTVILIMVMSACYMMVHTMMMVKTILLVNSKKIQKKQKSYPLIMGVMSVASITMYLVLGLTPSELPWWGSVQ